MNKAPFNSKNEFPNVILAYVNCKPLTNWEVEEFYSLTNSAGYNVAGYIFQQRETPDGRYYIGLGKLNDLKSVSLATKSSKIIFYNELKGHQFFQLEKELGIEVIDRTMLIIEIFSKNAVSNEGKLQVELMYKKKMLPRIMGQGLVMSNQGGGGAGGTGARRGIGEQQKELDKRTIKNEIKQLENKLEKLSEERAIRRKNRERNRCFTISLVGYTNAGKTTLMNALSNTNAEAKDQLFVTLDPLSRRISTIMGREILLTDTVGFISNLPHEFVRAFRSTLEETISSDLILHVVDGSSPVAYEQYNVVNSVLDSIGASQVPSITVVNKSDCGIFSFVPHSDNFVAISAKNRINLDSLIKIINKFLTQKIESEKVIISKNNFVGLFEEDSTTTLSK
ncbi:MAG: GTPase HflX [Firmicutes bacterium ADurb.Bin080]|jgi:GTPase|nr:GTPase HflX [Clostridiales bacterium]OQC12368.1 MAG: GTPase HflX [Firmicutes bacterium ADurb.Bin080]